MKTKATNAHEAKAITDNYLNSLTHEQCSKMTNENGLNLINYCRDLANEIGTESYYYGDTKHFCSAVILRHLVEKNYEYKTIIESFKAKLLKDLTEDMNEHIFKAFKKYYRMEQDNVNDYQRGCIQTANALMPALYAIILDILPNNPDKLNKELKELQ